MSKTIKIEAKSTPRVIGGKNINQKSGPTSIQTGSTLNMYQ